MNNIQLGELITSERKKQGLSKNHLAKLSQCVPNTINNAENGDNVGICTIIDILGKLGMKLKVCKL